MCGSKNSAKAKKCGVKTVQKSLEDSQNILKHCTASSCAHTQRSAEGKRRVLQTGRKGKKIPFLVNANKLKGGIKQPVETGGAKKNTDYRHMIGKLVLYAKLNHFDIKQYILHAFHVRDCGKTKIFSSYHWTFVTILLQ